MRPQQSALIVPVPEAETLVNAFRSEWDRSAGWGVPAHVTVLYPFLPPDQIDQDVLASVAEAVASVPVFMVTFARLSWFDDQVLWLAPDPDEPFRALTRAVMARFPAYRPYGGQFVDNVPHLTVGHDAPVPVLRTAADALRPRLPFNARVTAARLLWGSPEPGGWHPGVELPLGPAPER